MIKVTDNKLTAEITLSDVITELRILKMAAIKGIQAISQLKNHDASNGINGLAFLLEQLEQATISGNKLIIPLSIKPTEEALMVTVRQIDEAINLIAKCPRSTENYGHFERLSCFLDMLELEKEQEPINN